jgi:hypothetical protein
VPYLETTSPAAGIFRGRPERAGTGTSYSSPMSELSDQIQTNAAAPKKVQTDAGSVEQQSIQDLIAADQYTKPAAQQKVRNRQFRHKGVGF